MRKNQLLGIALIMCKAISLLQILVFAALTALLIYWHINPGYFAGMKPVFGSPIDHQFGYSVTENWSAGAKQTALNLNNITYGSAYFIYLQMSGTLLMIFLSVKEFGNIIRSVRVIQTFRRTNAHSLRNIGKYLFGIFILSGFSTIHFHEARYLGLHINFTPLLMMLVAYILAEVFEEGNALLEENQLTV